MGLLDWLFNAKPRSGRFGQHRHRPAGEWVQTTPTVPVVGMHHRRADVLSFFRAVQQAEEKDRSYGVELRRDPSNAYDANAIAIDGHADGRRWHIGFLDRDTAKEITEDLTARGIPAAAELYNLWLGDDGYMDATIIILAPPGNSTKVRLKRR